MIDATSFDCHHPFPFFLLLLLSPVSPAPTPPASSSSHTPGLRAAGLTRYSMQEKSMKETERGGLRGRNEAKWRGNTILDSSVMLLTSILRHTNSPKNTPATHLHFYLLSFSWYHTKYQNNGAKLHLWSCIIFLEDINLSWHKKNITHLIHMCTHHAYSHM